ncbi:MAG: BREX system Lon protease-like protein BrxL, partial [Candidatus Lokiarchaeota archaeon]|nr:BREX system Lon protease-like protein BrxL [Candidatus Lokiarchaeota archaeon]MBD3343372.1 BREX system Lon protease-like protein BrxL [Candidatus Lokiarchaeota archaeon]
MSNKLPPLDKLDKKSKEAFPNEVVRKHYACTISELESFPTYVSEYLISLHANKNGILPKDAIRYIVDEVKKKRHEKKDKEAIKSIALDLGSVEIIDHFDVYCDLRRGKYYTDVSLIDERATVNRDLVLPSRFQELLKGGLWGKASFQHIKHGDLASLNMNDFEGYQMTNVIFKSYLENRRKFTTAEWISFLIRSIGLNPETLSHKQKLLYLCRLIPFVQPFTNLLELGPPGTGKSYIYENISEYCRILVGGEITPAKMIYNQNTKQIGIIFKKDIICFDEINKNNTKLKKIIPKLQQVMASNQIERGDMEARTEASLVFQGNIDFIYKDNKSQPKEKKFLKILPKDMYDSAFLDRIHLFIHGWEIPRISDVHVNKNLGLIGNYFGQILHKFRREHVSFLIDQKVNFYKIDHKGNKRGLSLRDKKALYNTICGLIKLIYPHKEIEDNEWREMIELAIELRQNIINEIIKIDKTLERTIKYEFIANVNEREESIDSEELEQDVKKVEEEREEIKKKDTEELQIDLNTIEINDENFLTKKIPYWILKILVQEGLIDVEKNFFKICDLNQFDGISIINSNNDPIGAISKIRKEDIDYSDDEDNVDIIEEILNELRNQIDNYDKTLYYLNYFKFRASSLEDDQEILELIRDLEEKEKHLPINSNIFIRENYQNINKTIDLIQKSRGMQPDLLSTNYAPILYETSKNIDELTNLKKRWKNLNKRCREINPIFKKLNKIIKRQQKTKKKSELIYEGGKFPLFAIDVNNLMISFFHKFSTIRIKTLLTPIEKLKDRYLRKKPYLANFFTSAHLTKYLHPIPQDEYHNYYIEKWYKNRAKNEYVDVDASLSAYSGKFIEMYKNQISHFYIGSG